MKYFCAILFTLFSGPALAAPPLIEGAEAIRRSGGWTISVTISHPDTGWEHYADGWEVLSPEGESLGLRVLVHPHVDEQPFTRSLGGVDIPEGIGTVFIRARCSVDGWAEQRFELALDGS